MNTLLHTHLETLLRVVAAGQLIIAVLGPMLPRLLHWEAAIARMPLLVREVFQIHTWFIGLTCAIFAAITWTFAADLARPTHDLMRWFTFSIGFFWGIRCIMQWTHYSASHWRGLGPQTLAHWMLFFGYGGFAITYFLAAFTHEN